jgi:hypothetical protein
MLTMIVKESKFGQHQPNHVFVVIDRRAQKVVACTYYNRKC